MRTTIQVMCGIVMSCAVIWAQAGTAQINGTVRDATGLAVPGAEVKVTQTDTGAVRTATSGADGSYVLPNLPIGPYSLEVSKEGFSKYAQTGIVLQVDSGLVNAFAKPKSSSLTTPSGVILILAGFKSRWTTPLSCAYSSAAARCQNMAEG